MIEPLDTLAIIQGQKIVETTVRFSNLENDLNHGYIGYFSALVQCHRGR